MNVDTGQLQAITERLDATEAALAELAARVDRAFRIEELMRRADFGAPAPAPHRDRLRHLKAVR